MIAKNGVNELIHETSNIKKSEGKGVVALMSAKMSSRHLIDID